MKNIAIHIVMTDFRDTIFQMEIGIVIIVNNNYDSDNYDLIIIVINKIKHFLYY